MQSVHRSVSIVGFEQELLGNIGLQINYVHKRGEDFGGGATSAAHTSRRRMWTASAPTPPARAFSGVPGLTSPARRHGSVQLSNVNGMFMRYNGLSIQAQRRMANRWQLTGSIVVSKSEGRLGSSGSSPTSSQTGTPLVVASGLSFGQDPNHFVNSDGLLIGDRPIVAQVAVRCTTPRGASRVRSELHISGRAALGPADPDRGPRLPRAADRVDGTARWQPTGA